MGAEVATDTEALDESQRSRLRRVVWICDRCGELEHFREETIEETVSKGTKARNCRENVAAGYR